MTNKEQRTRMDTQDDLDNDKARQPSDLGLSDDNGTDEISASIHVISAGEERRQRHQGSGADNGLSVSGRDHDGAIEGLDDEETLRDELRPKDGSKRTKAKADADDEGQMPTGLAKKPGFEDYNPAARPHSP